jgi:orotate phosphoribosyltransferase
VTKANDKRLLEVFKEHAILHGDFTLSSGLKSSYYFDGRLVTLWPEGAYLIGKKIFDILKGTGAEAVGGMTMGADPMVSAVAVVSHLEGKPIPAFIVRAEMKGHGTQKRIEGPLQRGSRVAIVDDVITTGGSVLRAIEAVEAEGCQVVKVVVLLDRHQGGSDEIRRRGYDFQAILSADAEGEVRIA